MNLSGEIIISTCQTKFKVMSAPPLSGTSAPDAGTFAYVDKLPVIHARGAVDPNSSDYNPNSPGGCVSVDAWKSGSCTSTPTVVSIPFFIAGLCLALSHPGA